MSGHQLIRSTDNEEVNPVVYKFHRSYKLASDASATVWSSDAGEIHDPPTTLVMKNLKWPSDDSIITKLVNSEGEVRGASVPLPAALVQGENGEYGQN